jgi:integrase
MTKQRESTLKLIKRKDSPYYFVSGTHNGVRVRESTGQRTLGGANIEFSKIISGLDAVTVSSSTFSQVVDVHLNLITKKTAYKDFEYSKKLEKFFGEVPMSEIGFRPKQFQKPYHILNQYIMSRAKDDISITTINKEIAFLNLIGSKAVKEYGLLSNWVPIRLVDKDESVFYGFNAPGKKLALEYDWQVVLFNRLPIHLTAMALFSVHTGQRDAVVCNLRWDWLGNDDDEVSYFKVPANHMKSGREAYVVLNDYAYMVVQQQKGNRSPYVFCDNNGDKIPSQHCYAYRFARDKAAEKYPDIANTDVHSYKRTFVTRLYGAGVPHDWVQRLANHKLPEITEIYHVMGPQQRAQMYKYLQLLCVGRPSLTLHKGVANG